MSDLLKLNISQILSGLSKREFSATEVTKAYLSEIKKTEMLNMYLEVTSNQALKMAQISDENYKNKNTGLLEGVPIGIKDMFCTKGVKTTASSRILDNFIPPYESTVTKKLWENGAIQLGKLSCDEFAMGSSNETAFKGNVINPWNFKEKRSPGGSSGGSAAAVAAKAALSSIGTDTGGSIRQPAAFCGVVGLKPTYGRCSRWGIIAFASSLDQAGPLTRTVSDSAIMLKAMAGHDPKDSTSSNQFVPNYEDFLGKNIKGLKIGIPDEYQGSGVSDEIINSNEKVINFLKKNGAEILKVSLPLTKYALPVYYIVAPAEASSNLSRYDGVRYGLRVESDSLDEMYEKTRDLGFGDEVKRRIIIGTYVLSSGYYDAYYLKAQKVRRLIKNEFDEVFKKVDFLLTPTTPTTSFKLGSTQDLLTMYLNDIFTVPASLAGIPGISIPVSLDSQGLPIGIQILARPFDEGGLFKIGKVIEDCANFNFTPQDIKND